LKTAMHFLRCVEQQFLRFVRIATAQAANTSFGSTVQNRTAAFIEGL